MLEIGFILLSKRNELIILALIRYIIENIRKNTIHIALSIKTYKARSLYINISGI